MAGMGLQDDSQSADGQLTLGLQLIQQSYNRRVEELTREVEHWKRVAQHHKQQEAQTREELGKSNQRGSELQRQLGEKTQEAAQLTEARNVAQNQIATLKKHASQLQSFKKNISNMLQNDPGMDVLGLQGMIDNLPQTVDSTFTSNMNSPAIDFGMPKPSANYFNGSTDMSNMYGGPPPSLSAPMGGGYQPTGGGYPHAATSAPPKPQAPPAPAPAAPEVTMDAATYYQQVKRVLEPDQFREFSANIKKLNAGQQSVDETLEKVREIFGEHRPFLFAQLQKLIRQAEEEASQQAAY